MTTNQYGSEYDQYIDGHYTDNRKPQDENLLNKVELTKDEIYKETKEKQLKELREKYNYRYTYIQEEIKSRFYDPGASSQQDYYRLLQTEYAQSLIIDFVIRQNSKEGIKKVFSTDNPNLVAEAKQINTNYGDVIEDAYNCIAGDNGIVTQNGVDSKLWKDLTKNGTDRETMDVDNISSIQIEVQYNRTDEQEVCETETTTADVKETTTSKNNVRIKKDKNSSENSFVRLLHHSKKARGNFDIIDVWFFESMEETTAIADLVDLLKYLFYLVYNKDYGVSTDEKDYIDLFNPEKMSSVSRKQTSAGTIVGGASYSSITISDEDLQVLYKLVQAEGGGGTHEQVMYITCTILNRILSSTFNVNTVSEVANASGQFEVMWNGMYDAAVPSTDTIDAVNEAIQTGDITGGSIGFQNDWLYDSQYPNQTYETPIELLRETWPSGSVVVFFTTASIQAELSQYK